MEGVLLFAPLSLQGLRTGQPKIALGSPRGAEWCSRLRETRVLCKTGVSPTREHHFELARTKF